MTNNERPCQTLKHALLYALMIAFTASACSEATPTGTASYPPAPVTPSKTIAKDTPYTLECLGYVHPKASVKIKPRITGQVKKILVKDGQFVKQGDVLYLIDDKLFQMELRKVAAQYSHTLAQVKLLERECARMKQLISTGTVSQEAYDEKQTSLEVAKSDSKATLAQALIAKQNINYCEIKSPINGTAGKHQTEKGDIVNANADVMITINQTKPALIRFTLPEKYLLEIKKYNSVSPLKVFANAKGVSTPAVGTLKFIDNQINKNTGMISLEAEFPNQQEKLWPGQMTKVKLELFLQEKAILCPFRAVQTGPTGKFVWVVNKNKNVALPKPVVLGERVGENIIITKGLKANETVVIDGQLRLAPGAKVLLQEKADKHAKSGKSKSPVKE